MGSVALHPVSGLLTGAALGYGIGKYVVVGAWVFPLFLVLGLGIGCMNAYRDVRSMMRASEDGDAAKKPS